MSSRRKYFVVLLIFVSLVASTDALAATRRRTRTKANRARVTRHHRLRRVMWNPLFRGSHDMLVRQNVVINELELPRIMDDDQLIGLISNEDLVRVHESNALAIAGNLTETRRYCRPWLREFLEDFSQAFYEEWGRPIQVNSLVRTAEQQKKLRRHNRNAAPQDGETASTHMTGMTVDISKRGLSKAQHKWIEEYFLPFRDEGIIDPIEERRQPVFHVTVYQTYTQWKQLQQPQPEEPSTDTRQGSQGASD